MTRTRKGSRLAGSGLGPVALAAVGTLLGWGCRTVGHNPPHSNPDEPLSSSTIDATIRSHGPTRDCFEAAIGRGVPLGGTTVRVLFTVEPSGRVSAFELENQHIEGELTGCLHRSFGQIIFPSGETPKRVRYPFEIQ